MFENTSETDRQKKMTSSERGFKIIQEWPLHPHKSDMSEQQYFHIKRPYKLELLCFKMKPW